MATSVLALARAAAPSVSTTVTAPTTKALDFRRLRIRATTAGFVVPPIFTSSASPSANAAVRSPQVPISSGGRGLRTAYRSRTSGASWKISP
nr:hypothetical protein [Fodinicola feengrottensis]